MSHEVETMFYTRTTPWHGLGVRVEDAPTSADALHLAGLDWTVIQSPIYIENVIPIIGYKANVRQSDNKVLGVVSYRYKIVQNAEAFQFTDQLIKIDSGVRYETAGSLQGGKKVWLLARLPEEYKVLGDSVTQYLVFSNAHDGSSGIKIALTPVRVVCANTLAIALHDASRIWSVQHTGDINAKLDEARKALALADYYMDKLSQEAENLNKIRIPDKKVMEIITELIPEPENATPVQRNNVNLLRTDFKLRYFEAPDLEGMDKSAWRFLNAASDFCGHVKPLRQVQGYQENLFVRTIEGNGILDKAYQVVKVM